MDSLSECVGSREYQVRSSDFVKHAQKYCQETSQRRNRDVPVTLLPSPRTLKRFDTRLDLRNAHAEAITVARANACSSVRNAVSFAVMNMLMSTVVPPQLQLNVDGTQFCVGSKDNGRIVVKMTTEDSDTLSNITLLLLRLGLHLILYSCLRIIL